MASGPNTHNSLEALLKDNQTRLTLVERRLATQGGGGGGNGDSTAVGAIQLWASTTPPQDYMLCQGQAVARATYPDLFSAIGTTYGSGDGSTTFNLPNLKGRVAVGQDVAQAEFDVLGETGGAKTVTLTALQSGLRSHNHALRVSSDEVSGYGLGTSASFTNRPLVTGTGSASSGTSGPNDALEAHNNLQPYLVLNYIIRVTRTVTGGGTVTPTHAWGVLDATYRTGGKAKVRIDGDAALSGPYEWQTTYIPGASRRVSLAWSGTEWIITGQVESGGNSGFAALALGSGWGSYSARTLVRDWNEKIGSYRLPTGLVVLTGLAFSINAPANNTLVGTIPDSSHWPEYETIMWCDYADLARTITITVDGRILTRGTGWAAAQYLNLDGLCYWAKDSEATGNWMNVGTNGSTLGAAFTTNSSWNTTHGYPAFYKDRYGFVWFRGLVQIATTLSADNTPIVALPAAYRAYLEQHFRSSSNEGYCGLGANPSTGLNWKVSPTTAVGNWVNLNGAVLNTADANTLNTWFAPSSLQNSWQNYNPATFPPAGWMRREDGLVKFRGLINGGSTTTQFASMDGYPELYPRARRLILGTISNQARARIDLQSDTEDSGRNPRSLLPASGVSNAWLSLDGIQYVP